MHLGFLGAMIIWFSDQAVGWMSIRMVGWIPNRGKRFISSPDYPDQLWGQPTTYSTCSRDAFPSGKWLGRKADELPQSSMTTKNE